MPNNPKKPGSNAGNTFTRSEIESMTQLFAALYAGRDTSVLIRNPDIGKTYGKFRRMKTKLDAVSTALEDDDG